MILLDTPWPRPWPAWAALEKLGRSLAAPCRIARSPRFPRGSPRFPGFFKIIQIRRSLAVLPWRMLREVAITAAAAAAVAVCVHVCVHGDLHHTHAYVSAPVRAHVFATDCCKQQQGQQSSMPLHMCSETCSWQHTWVCPSA